MLHRESGVFKTSYAAYMALYPLPIARWTILAIIVLFAVILPLSLHEYYLSIINLSLIAIVGALALAIAVHCKLVGGGEVAEPDRDARGQRVPDRLPLRREHRTRPERR